MHHNAPLWVCGIVQTGRILSLIPKRINCSLVGTHYSTPQWRILFHRGASYSTQMEHFDLPKTARLAQNNPGFTTYPLR